MECDQIMDVVVSALATLVAAFAGAWFAFYLQEKKEYVKEEKERKSNLNLVLVTLVRQYQSLENIKLEIDSLKEDALVISSCRRSPQINTAISR